MCLGIVGLLEANKGEQGTANINGLKLPVNLTLLPDVKAGDYILIHAGFALKKVDHRQILAQETASTFNSKYQVEIYTKIAKEIQQLAKGLPPLTVMEVCGTHTVAIARYGLKKLLPQQIRLVSGPGCPVCVTPTNELDAVINLVNDYPVTLVTFGDMLRVPGSFSNLEEAKAKGASVKVVYSPEQALLLAQNTKKDVVFLAIGFETTAPLVAQLIKKAFTLKLKNFSLFLSHRLIPPALDGLLSLKTTKVDGLILPGHVSTVIGLKAYRQLQRKYKLPMVVAGFTPEQILLALKEIVLQKVKGQVKLDSVYKSTVTEEGNKEAQASMANYFQVKDALWRGIGVIPNSGLELQPQWRYFAAQERYQLHFTLEQKTAGCLCAQILIGAKTPKDCRLFARACTPESPKGPCMVSSEGSCQAEYIYGQESSKQVSISH